MGEAAYRCVRTRFGAILDLMDPSPLPKSRRLDDATFRARAQASQSAHTEAGWGRRLDGLEWFINQVIEASLSTLSNEVWTQWKGSIGVDATLVPSFARGPKRPKKTTRERKAREILIHSVDPDAGWYSREHDDRDDGTTQSGATTSTYGYEATLAVAGADSEEDAARFPSVVMGMAVLDRPAHEVGRNGPRALASVRARGHPAFWLRTAPTRVPRPRTFSWWRAALDIAPCTTTASTNWA